jgi:hypothetical protein
MNALELPQLSPTPHPYVPWLTDEQLCDFMGGENGPAAVAEIFNEREAKIRSAEEDPFNNVFKPRYVFEDGTKVEPWDDAEKLAMAWETDIVAIFGGNRSQKSHFCAWKICRNLMRYPQSMFVCLAEKEDTSITQQQALIWHYLPKQYKMVQNRKDRRGIYKVNYNQSNGFAERKAVFPNRTELHFLTYNQIATDYEGWEFGSKQAPCIAVWADESLPLAWLQMFHRRLKYRRAKMVWAFTAVKGITPAMKELLGKTARTERHLPAELLPTTRWHDCPSGRMPYIQTPSMARCKAIYFHSIFNQFYVSQTPDEKGRLLTYYDQIKAQCLGKPSDYIARIAYGGAKDTIWRAFPKFGPWNVVKRDHLPKVGTNYRFIDPAGARNWFILWVRVVPGNPPMLYVYREWPDVPSYGEWAVASEKDISAESRTGWDGVAGPAQTNLGWGLVRYKQMMLEKEGPDEKIQESYIDPRAGANPHAEEHGGTCLLDQINEPQIDPKTGEVLAPAMECLPASGVRIGSVDGGESGTGLGAVNEFLDWNTDEPMVPLINAPRFYVVEDCENVIWAMANYTARGGEMGGCKDAADLVRYACLAPLEYVNPQNMKARKGGSY